MSDRAVTPPPDETRDLGFGRVVTTESRLRLLNRDGSFNVERVGLGFFESMSAYHTLLTMSWPRFLWSVTAFYFAANLLFGLAYWLLGPDALAGPIGVTAAARFRDAFFFSVETFGTIGYGRIAPASFGAHVVMTVESLTGLMSLALVTGILFARFARPSAALTFSDRALIAPFRAGLAFEFRIANRRKSELLDVEARVLYSRYLARDGRRVREFHELGLERRNVVFFPLAWTVVHPIDETSPLADATPQRLAAEEAEFLVLLTGIDETFAQRVHARTSYRHDEVVWNARFTDIYTRPENGGRLAVDVSRLHTHEPAAR